MKIKPDLLRFNSWSCAPMWVRAVAAGKTKKRNGNSMKKRTVVTLALALGLAALSATAQDAGGQAPRGDRPARPEGGPAGPGPGGPGRGGFRPPISPLEEALDANHDGIISAEEIANASAALKKLDKNGDGQLTPDEFRPMRRGPGRPPGGPDGQGGPGPAFDRGAGNPPSGDDQNRPPRRPAGE